MLGAVFNLPNKALKTAQGDEISKPSLVTGVNFFNLQKKFCHYDF